MIESATYHMQDVYAIEYGYQTIPKTTNPSKTLARL